MRPITTAELLNIWEQYRNRTLLEKTLLLLDVACSDGDPEDPAGLNIGDRDARLIQLREWMFGSQLLNITNCPECGEHIEWSTNVTDLRFPSVGKPGAAFFSIEVDAYNIKFRLPNSYDLSKASSSGDFPSKLKKILTECIIDVQKEDHPYQADDLPDQVLNILDERMAIEDPQADIRMNLSCPECSYLWQAQFDIVSYLWTEIDSWAKHILQDIAVLAATFGWSESEILNLSPQRRQLYLEIIRK